MQSSRDTVKQADIFAPKQKEKAVAFVFAFVFPVNGPHSVFVARVWHHPGAGNNSSVRRIFYPSKGQNFPKKVRERVPLGGTRVGVGGSTDGGACKACPS